MRFINCRTKYWRNIYPILQYTRRLIPKLMRIREISHRSTTKGLHSSTVWRIYSQCICGASKPRGMYCELYPLIYKSNLTFYIIFHNHIITQFNINIYRFSIQINAKIMLPSLKFGYSTLRKFNMLFIVILTLF